MKKRIVIASSIVASIAVVFAFFSQRTQISAASTEVISTQICEKVSEKIKTSESSTSLLKLDETISETTVEKITKEITEKIKEKITVSITFDEPLTNAPGKSIDGKIVAKIFNENFDQTDIRMIAQTVYGEAGAIKSKTEQAAVIWCILNRYDGGVYEHDIKKIITQPCQFYGYCQNHPVTKEIKNLTIDVLTRWCLEKTGFARAGRVLPKEYIAFYGDGEHNYFSVKQYGEIWNWSLTSPYNT